MRPQGMAVIIKNVGNERIHHKRDWSVKIAKFGVRKHLFSTYLAEFIWRYMHRDEDLFSVLLNDVKKVYATSTTKP